MANQTIPAIQVKDSNVGIGTISPSSKLHVITGTTGNISIFEGGSGRYVQIGTDSGGQYIEQVGNSSGERILRIQNSNGSGAYTQLFLDGGNQRIYTSTNVNVGIGTSSPTNKLEVYTSATAENVFSVNNGTQRLQLGVNNSEGSFVFEQNSYALRFGTANTERMRITAAGNVGIGTTSPSYRLHVQDSTITGTIALGHLLYPGLIYSDAGSGEFRIDNRASTGGFISFYPNGQTTIGNERMRITSSGNVGIGITSPVHKLTFDNNTFISFNNDTSNPFGIGGGDNAMTRIVMGASSGASSSIQLGVGSSGQYSGFTSLMTIKPSGNVGIGTTSPTYKLNVVTDAISGRQDLTNINRAAGNLVTFTNPQFSADASMGLLLRVFPQSDSRQGAGIIASGGSFNGETDLSLFVSSGSSSSVSYGALNIKGGSGNVGIGTTSPSSRLEVGNFLDAFTNSITVSSRYEYVPQFTFKLGQSGTNYDWTGGVISCGDDGNYNGIIYFKTANAGRDAPTTKMVIKASGNVGIGTTSPSQTLTIQKSGYPIIDFYDGATGRGDIGYNTGTTSFNVSAYSSTPLAIYTNGAERMRITSGGNVGIGTTSPNYKLHVSGNVYINETLFVNQLTTVEDSLIVYDNLGVGTTTPGYKLDVSGVTSTQGLYIPGLYTFGQSQSGIEMQLTSTSYNAIRFYQGTDSTGVIHSFGRSWGGGVSVGMVNIEGYNGVTIGAWNIPTATFLSSGNVGIGTTSPSYKLHVEGNVSGISIYASHDIAAFSDITVKKEVKKIENAIEKVKELNGYTYVRTDDETGTRRAGVIAQEVQKVLPEVVSANPDGTLNVAYSNMIALLIEGMKEQQKEIDELKKLLKK